MPKKVDKNGYWFIAKNPISKVGVFDYLGSSISDECEPNKIYKVYRPAETLVESLPTWDNPPKPFINDHEMLGEGFAKIDDRPVQGVIYNPVYEDGTLYADMAVYSEALKQQILDGKKELSLGYFCNFEKKSGQYNDTPYDYVQTNMVGNHIALVDAGRCGNGVRVFDKRCCMDALDINTEEEEPVVKSPDTTTLEDADLKKNQESAKIESTDEEPKGQNMAKYILVSEVDAIIKEAFKWGDGEIDPKAELIAKLLDAKSIEGVVPVKDEEDPKDDDKSKSESEDEDDVEEKEKAAKDKCGKDEDDADKDDKKEAQDAAVTKLLKKISDGIDTLLAKAEKETADEDDNDKDKEKAEDEDEEESKSDADKEKAEDEDDDDKSKSKAEDGVAVVIGQDKADFGIDPGIAAYLAD